MESKSNSFNLEKIKEIHLYKEIKTKYPLTQRGNEADKYLARLGELND